MDRILLALIILSLVLGGFGIYVLFYPNRYQNNGTICEKNAISTCNSIKNDYYIFGTIMIVVSLMIAGLALFEMFRLK
jgi:hypothetical protein